jgi:hypothetical protein
MKKFEKLAESLLKANPKLTAVYICDDRNAFSTQSQAKKHCEPRKIKYDVYTRDSIFSEEKKTTKSNKTKKQ